MRAFGSGPRTGRRALLNVGFFVAVWLAPAVLAAAGPRANARPDATVSAGRSAPFAGIEAPTALPRHTVHSGALPPGGESARANSVASVAAAAALILRGTSSGSLAGMARDVGADAGHLYDDWSRLRARRSNGNGVIALLERDSSGSRAPPVALRLAVSESLAAEAGTGAGERAIVIGEDMEGRVIPKAKELGADYYDPPPADPSKWMANNRRWINEKMDEGCRIYDCGAAPGRANYPGATSPYYQMELDQIARRGYTNRVRLRGD